MLSRSRRQLWRLGAAPAPAALLALAALPALHPGAWAHMRADSPTCETASAAHDAGPSCVSHAESGCRLCLGLSRVRHGIQLAVAITRAPALDSNPRAPASPAACVAPSICADNAPRAPPCFA